jgi:hypothetical protein
MDCIANWDDNRCHRFMVDISSGKLNTYNKDCPNYIKKEIIKTESRIGGEI